MTTYPIADPLRGKTVPDDGAFATDDQVMTGADPRAGVTGGVNITGNLSWVEGGGVMPAFSVPAPYLAGSCTILFKLRPQWVDGRHRAVARLGGSGYTVELTVGSRYDGMGGLTDPFYVMLMRSSDGASLESAPLGITLSSLVGRPLTVSLVLDSTGAPSVYLNGAAITMGGASITLDGTVQEIGAGVLSKGRFAGDFIDVTTLNRALTADEIKACNKGEIPAELARQGGTYTGAQAIAAGNVGSDFTIAGNTVTRNSSGYDVAKFALPFRVYSGMKVRIRANANVGAFLNILSFSGAAVFADPVNTAVPVGVDFERIYTIRAGIPDEPAFVFFESGTNGDSVTLYEVSVIGTVEHFAADQVTSLGRWIGKFGTSLIPGSGITPLNPQPVQRRHMSFSFDLTVPSFTGVPSGWTVSTGGTGNISITRPSYAHTNPSTACNRENNGFAASTQDPANSFVDLSNTSGTATNTSGTVDQSWDE